VEAVSEFRGVSFVCPFCGGKASAGYADGDEKTGMPTTLHDFPICAKFTELGPIEFLRAVNDHNERKHS
jgi:hypothetical protein